MLEGTAIAAPVATSYTESAVMDQETNAVSQAFSNASSETVQMITADESRAENILETEPTDLEEETSVIEEEKPELEPELDIDVGHAG